MLITRLSVSGTILSDTLFATYDPVDVRESAPSTTPPSSPATRARCSCPRRTRVGRCAACLAQGAGPC